MPDSKLNTVGLKSGPWVIQTFVGQISNGVPHFFDHYPTSKLQASFVMWGSAIWISGSDPAILTFVPGNHDEVYFVRYSNGWPSHVTLPFEYQTPTLSIIQMNPVFR